MRIEVRGLHKRFADLEALRGLSFEVPPGRRLGVVGPNGSGKSTLNRVLMGFLRYEGEVRLDGHAPLEERVRVAPRIAYVPQVAPGLAVPVRELLRAVTDLRGIPAQAIAKPALRLGLDVDAVARQPFRGLSGGTRQKLLVAIALASRASLMILDEPTASLDARSREAFFDLFGRLEGERTLVLCSHRLEEVRQLVDHVLLLEEGRLAWDGPAEEFLAASTASLLEVRVADADAGDWLRERGFRRGAGDWWLRRVGQAEKLALLPELVARLGPALRDVNVRDLESLEIGRDGREDAR